MKDRDGCPLYIRLRYDIESENCGCVNTDVPGISELSSEFRLLFVHCERFQDRLSFQMSLHFPYSEKRRSRAKMIRNLSDRYSTNTLYRKPHAEKSVKCVVHMYVV